VKSALSDSKSDLAQLLEDYVNAWYYTLKGMEASKAGQVEEAEEYFAQADALWSQTTVATPSFAVVE